MKTILNISVLIALVFSSSLSMALVQTSFYLNSDNSIAFRECVVNNMNNNTKCDLYISLSDSQDIADLRWEVGLSYSHDSSQQLTIINVTVKSEDHHEYLSGKDFTASISDDSQIPQVELQNLAQNLTQALKTKSLNLINDRVVEVDTANTGQNYEDHTFRNLQSYQDIMRELNTR